VRQFQFHWSRAPAAACDLDQHPHWAAPANTAGINRPQAIANFDCVLPRLTDRLRPFWRKPSLGRDVALRVFNTFAALASCRTVPSCFTRRGTLLNLHRQIPEGAAVGYAATPSCRALAGTEEQFFSLDGVQTKILD
jgi:hypothetical protein